MNKIGPHATIVSGTGGGVPPRWGLGIGGGLRATNMPSRWGWGMFWIVASYEHAAPLGLGNRWGLACYKHAAPLGLRNRWGLACYKHAVPLGLGNRWGLACYKHAAPLGLGMGIGPRRSINMPRLRRWGMGPLYIGVDAKPRHMHVCAYNFFDYVTAFQ